jgi:hypothetical protein
MSRLFTESLGRPCSIFGTFEAPVKLGTKNVRLGIRRIVKIETYHFIRSVKRGAAKVHRHCLEPFYRVIQFTI